jgi:hypothetical protein
LVRFMPNHRRGPANREMLAGSVEGLGNRAGKAGRSAIGAAPPADEDPPARCGAPRVYRPGRARGRFVAGLNVRGGTGVHRTSPRFRLEHDGSPSFEPSEIRPGGQREHGVERAPASRGMRRPADRDGRHCGAS